MAVVNASAMMVPLSEILDRDRSPLLLAAVVVLTGAFTAGNIAFWLTRWPTRRQSVAIVVIGVLCISGWTLSETNTAVATLTCTATAVTGSYIAFFHGPKLLACNFVVAVGLATVAATRLTREAGVPAAVAAFWLIWFLNVTIPLAIWGTARAMGRYAMKSDQDPLTGLLNRRGFIETITRRLAAGGSEATHLTVQMIDLDDFKRVNDTYGHAAGDGVLIAVAELLRRHAPPTATICRAGGEEFLVAVMSTSGTDGKPNAAALCGAISGLSHSVTASIGSSSVALERPERSATRIVEELIVAADKAMYAAKRNGGNQVYHA